MNYNHNCGRCGMLNHWGQCQLTACAFPATEARASANTQIVKSKTDNDPETVEIVAIDGVLFVRKKDGSVSPILVDVYGIPAYGDLILPEADKEGEG